MPASLERLKSHIQRKNPDLSESAAWGIATKVRKKQLGIKGKTTWEAMERKEKSALYAGFGDELDKIAGGVVTWGPADIMTPKTSMPQTPKFVEFLSKLKKLLLGPWKQSLVTP